MLFWAVVPERVPRRTRSSPETVKLIQGKNVEVLKYLVRVTGLPPFEDLFKALDWLGSEAIWPLA